MSKTMIQRVRDFKIDLDYKDVEWISGKWFKNKKEIDNINKFLTRTGHVKDGVNDLKNFKRTFIEVYGEEGPWPELPIITKAKELIRQGYKVEKLAYPLNEKELKILNYLLIGRPQYAVFFYGVGGSGKSTICNIFCQIFGRNNVFASNLIDISRFNIGLMDARLFYDDDMGKVDYLTLGIFYVIM